MFSCSGTNQCIHPATICDGLKDCKGGEDEEVCDLNGITCPFNCTCIMFQLSCFKGIIHFSKFQVPFLFISMTETRLFPLKETIYRFEKPFSLTLLKCNLKEICLIDYPKTIFVFHVTLNKIIFIKKYCFASLPNLKELKLNHNSILRLEHYSFKGLSSLIALDISNNPLVHISKMAFKPLLALRFLITKNINFINFDKTMFQGIFLETLGTIDFHWNCLISAARYEVKMPWYRSCTNLLLDNMTKHLFILTSILILGFNALCIAIQLFAGQQCNRSYTRIFISLNASDILFGIYLFLIQTTDTYYKDTFPLLEQFWRSSFICFNLFALVLMFLIGNQVFALLLAYIRFLVIVYPLSSFLKNRNTLSHFVSYVWLSLVNIGILVSILNKFISDFIPTTLCLPFVDPTGIHKVITAVIPLIVFTLLMSTIVLSSFHMITMRHLVQSKQAMSKLNLKHKSSVPSVLKMSVITLITLICWILSGITYVLLDFYSKYSSKLLALIVGVVLPSGSIVNSFIFVITFGKKHLNKNKKT